MGTRRLLSLLAGPRASSLGVRSQCFAASIKIGGGSPSVDGVNGIFELAFALFALAFAFSFCSGRLGLSACGLRACMRSRWLGGVLSSTVSRFLV